MNIKFRQGQLLLGDSSSTETSTANNLIALAELEIDANNGFQLSFYSLLNFNP